MIYRQEHPNPQWERENWRNLNGEWEFDFDFGKSAKDKELFRQGRLPKVINVPFCPESKLSGIGYTDFIPAVCYRRTFNINEDELSGRVFIHFGAVDYKSYIYINQTLVTTHIGGYSSFKADITDYVKAGENEVFVIAEDDTRSGEQPTGKQCHKYASQICDYTRTTGIWQTVWLEFTPKAYIKSAKYYPDAENGTITITGVTSCAGALDITADYQGKQVAKATVKTCGNNFNVCLKLDEIYLWEPGHGRLYNLELSFGDDCVKRYFGLRNVHLDGKKFMLNSKTFFQRFVLDQGFYPDGIYTAQSDEELKNDIKLSMDAGFNGARLHQKVFEKRFLYHCDKAGYPVWGEHANWGMDYNNMFACQNFICEWTEILERDFNHPSIIGWCPFNESWCYYENKSKNRILETVYKVTKQIDDTRPCIAISGNYHIDGMEIYDVHDYCGNIADFREGYAHINEGRVIDQIARQEGDIQKYSGQPVFVSEYGGFKWADEDSSGWGYGNDPKTIEEFMERYKNYTSSLLENPDIMGFCYTQLYDVEQEQNGLYTYERKAKFDMDEIKKINTQPAAIEK